MLQNDKLCLYLSKRTRNPLPISSSTVCRPKRSCWAIVDFKSGSLAYYYDNEGVICFDYYEMWKPKEE